ncbi:MAG: D-alanyl-D-alanine carboxypeptidase [Alicyclobacillus sp.]|nr:D-alanyl-D-alanine carboxypeptidase [Alicyclobacillus sp.]
MRVPLVFSAVLALPLLSQGPSAVAATLPQTNVQQPAVPTVLPNVEFRVRSDAGVDGLSLAQHLAPEAKAAVVMDFTTGKVLFEKDAHERLPIASVTKVMTLLLVMEAIDSGKLHLQDRIKASEHASSMGGSQIFLEPGESMTTADLLKGIAMASANDACVALAEHLAGSEAAFVDQMNQRARALGLKDTHFVNTNGLPAANHYSSAYDVAILSRELLKHPQITQFTSKYSDYLRQDSDHPFWLVNTNKLVRFYPGLDGLKTGYTADAKYCLSATAKRDGFRVITVVLGEPKATVRNREVSELFNWAFAEYQSKLLYPKGALVQELEVPHGTPEKIHVLTADQVGVIARKGEKADYRTELELDNVSAPLAKGQVVGKMRVKQGEEVVAEVPLVAGEDVKKAGFLTGLGRTVRGLITFGKS